MLSVLDSRHVLKVKGVAELSKDAIRANSPETTGADMEVPLMNPYDVVDPAVEL